MHVEGAAREAKQTEESGIGKRRGEGKGREVMAAGASGDESEQRHGVRRVMAKVFFVLKTRYVPTVKSKKMTA